MVTKTIDTENVTDEMEKAFHSEMIRSPYTTIKDSIKKALKVAPSVECEPVLCQYRVRPTFHAGQPWSSWSDCSKERFDYFVKRPIVNDCEFQARKLYEIPQQQIDEETRRMVLELCRLVESRFKSYDDGDINDIRELAAELTIAKQIAEQLRERITKNETNS